MKTDYREAYNQKIDELILKHKALIEAKKEGFISPLFIIFKEYLDKNNIAYDYFQREGTMKLDASEKDALTAIDKIDNTGYDLWIGMKIPDYYITNHIGDKRLIQGFYMCIGFSRRHNSYHGAFVFHRDTYSSDDVINKYFHSHGGQNFASMCFGKAADIMKNIDESNIEYRVELIKEMVTWESLEGVPVRRMPRAKDDDTSLSFIYPVLTEPDIKKYLSNASIDIVNGKFKVQIPNNMFIIKKKVSKANENNNYNKSFIGSFFRNGILESGKISDPEEEVEFINIKLKNYVHRGCEEYLGETYGRKSNITTNGGETNNENITRSDGSNLVSM